MLHVTHCMLHGAVHAMRLLRLSAPRSAPVLLQPDAVDEDAAEPPPPEGSVASDGIELDEQDAEMAGEDDDDGDGDDDDDDDGDNGGGGGGGDDDGIDNGDDCAGAFRPVPDTGGSCRSLLCPRVTRDDRSRIRACTGNAVAVVITGTTLLRVARRLMASNGAKREPRSCPDFGAFRSHFRLKPSVRAYGLVSW